MWCLAGAGHPGMLGRESESRQGPRAGRWSNAGCCGGWEGQDEPQNASSSIWVGAPAGSVGDPPSWGQSGFLPFKSGLSHLVCTWKGEMGSGVLRAVSLLLGWEGRAPWGLFKQPRCRGDGQEAAEGL